MTFKKQVVTLLLAVMATVGTVSADNRKGCDPCIPSNFCAYDVCEPCDNWCDGFCLGVDLLWWHPCINDLDYGVTFAPTFTETPISEPISGKFHHLCHDYSPGVRVSLFKEAFWCDWDLKISYTYYHSEETDRVRVNNPPNEVNITTVHPTFAGATAGGVFNSARHKLSYQTLDALFGREFCLCDDHRFMPFFGIEGLKLNRHLSTSSEDLAGNDVFAGWDAHVKALGLKIGTEYNHTLCDCLDFFARASASMLAGDLDASSKSNIDADAALDFDHADCCLFIPGYHLQAGFTYCTCCCSQEMLWRLGYEFLEWRNVPTAKRFFSDTPGYQGASTPGTGATLGMHGLFAGLEFCF